MEYFPAPLEKLVEQFARLPGIGGKSAQRLAFYVLGLPEEEAKEFADAILDAKRSVTCCPVCQNFTAGGLCPICASPKRDGTTICVVADPRDVAGYDLTKPLGDFDKTVWQGINGPIWALIALDSGNYEVPVLPATR